MFFDQWLIYVPTEWCQSLTVLSGQRAALSFLTHLQAFIASALHYVEGITKATGEDRLALRKLWQSQTLEDKEEQANEDEGEQTTVKAQSEHLDGPIRLVAC